MTVPKTAPATEAMMRNAAIRAANDPKSLARAARIVSAALTIGRLTLADLADTSAHPSIPAGRWMANPGH